MVSEHWDSIGLNDAYNTSSVTGFNSELARTVNVDMQSTQLTVEEDLESQESNGLRSNVSLSFGGFSPVQEGELGNNQITVELKRVG